ncbi:MAG: translation termination inhibitor protein itt1 [Alyxoria varia]|nr:MAG: translation termination inhibitor protein itt1 [Alyxoria varia]
MTEELPEDERNVELSSIAAIFPELQIDPENPHAATLDLEVKPSIALPVIFAPSIATSDHRTLDQPDDGAPLPTPPASRKNSARGPPNEPVAQPAPTESRSFTHLPPLHLEIELPDGYPEDCPPIFRMNSQYDWLPPHVLQRLDKAGQTLWDEYGRVQVVFSYIDHLQQEAELGFGFSTDPSSSSSSHPQPSTNPSEVALAFTLPLNLKDPLTIFETNAKIATFNAGTYDCGICLEPKKGSSCHQLTRCSHVFCKSCLQDFYNAAITEGDVVSVVCPDPDCGKEELRGERERRTAKKARTLHPRELLDIGIERGHVQRYVDMKLKKRLESDRSTIYCPRQWCQAPARSKRVAKYDTKNLEDIPPDSSSDEEGDDGEEQIPHEGQQAPHDGVNANNNNNNPPRTSQKRATPATPPAPPANTPPPDRLTICSRCTLAFCRICLKSWHGDFLNCRPTPSDPTALSPSDIASLEFIRKHTSACPTCLAPCQKIRGCNHMRCATCETHFCYLCGAWLDRGNPYKHFGNRGGSCYMKLWEFEEGAEGEGFEFLWERGLEGVEGYEEGEEGEVGWDEHDEEDGPGDGYPDPPPPRPAVAREGGLRR